MKLTKQYIAGLFDGEGCVFADKVSNNSNVMCLRTSICMCHKILITKLYKQFGGSFAIYKPINIRHSIAYDWRLSGLMAIKFLKYIQPFLIVKKQVVKVALEYEYFRRGFCRQNPVPQKEIRRRLNWRNRMRYLNKRGRKDMEELS